MNRSRYAFTLVELLVVIVILGVLMALLLPAIQGSIRTAKDAACMAEIGTLAQALESFKARYGSYPPSRVILNETVAFSDYPSASTLPLDSPQIPWRGSGMPYRNPQSRPNTSGTANDLTFGELAARSAQALRTFYPRAGVPDVTNANVTLRHFHDFDGSGAPEPGWLLLEGDECLAFFLGGMPSTSGTGLVGVAKDATWPFRSDAATPNPQFPAMSTANRQPPFYEFSAGRLIDRDEDGIPSYLDPLNTGTDAREYVYFSAYGSNGYDPNDVNMPEEDARMAGPLSRPFRTARALVVPSPSPNPYTSTVPIPLSGACPDPASSKPTVWEKAQSYQIVSAGRDGFYGLGGQRDASPTAGNPLPLPDADCPALGLEASLRDLEADNLANFASRGLGR